jgi:L-ascorbate metabolism protein UlaG (beta-lactamase superfamily)
MDAQYFGGNCVVLANKGTRIVIDDNLAELGLKSITKQGDIILFTGLHQTPTIDPRLLIEGPGEYEASDLSIVGVAARAHIDEAGTHNATIYKILVGGISYLFIGDVYPELNEEQLEAIGIVDVMFVPVGGNGYTLDVGGALRLIKAVEPKLVVPTHYADSAIHYPVEQQSLEQVLKNIGMEPREVATKLRLKQGEIISSTTQLEILSRV